MALLGWVVLAAVLVWLLAAVAWDEWQQRVVAGWCWRCGALLPVKLFAFGAARCPAGGPHEMDADVTRQEMRHQRVPGRP